MRTVTGDSWAPGRVGYSLPLRAVLLCLLVSYTTLALAEHALRLQLHLAVLDREKVCVTLLQPACHRCLAFDARYGCG